MLSRYRLEILALVSVLLFSILLLGTGKGTSTGSDDLAFAQISRMTGIPEDQFHPLLWQWIPPSPEVESALFVLQAAIGGLIIGLVFLYWKGARRREGEKE